MHYHLLLPCKEVVRCKNEFFWKFHFSLSSIFDTCKNNLVCIFPSSLSALIPCKFVENSHNRSSWELTYTVAEKIEEKRSRRERMEEFSLTIE
jgi:hypothetical protein